MIANTYPANTCPTNTSTIYIYIPPKPSHSCFLLLVNYQFDLKVTLKCLVGSLIFQQLVYVHSRLFSPWRRLSSRQTKQALCPVIVWLQKVVAIKGAILFQTNDLLFQPGHLWRIRRNGEGMACLPAGDPEANFCRPWRIILNKYHQISDIITGWWLTTCFNYLENMSKSMGRMTSRIWNGK